VRTGNTDTAVVSYHLRSLVDGLWPARVETRLARTFARTAAATIDGGALLTEHTGNSAAGTARGSGDQGDLSFSF